MATQKKNNKFTANSNSKKTDSRPGKEYSNGKTSNYNKKDNRNRKGMDKSMSIPGENEVAWYAYSSDALNSAASLYFPEPIGLPLRNGDNGTAFINPGVMVLEYTPTFGPSEMGDASSPMNVARQSLYAFVRHANSGSKNYEGADLFMYMLAMDSLYALYYEARRAYGISTLYSRSNRYYPKVILEAMGWDPDDVISNSANFRSYLNNMAYALGSFAVPEGMTLFDRRRYLAQNVFLDDTGAKAQSYLFRMSAFWKWQGFTDPEGTELVLWDIASEFGTETGSAIYGPVLTVDSFYKAFMNIVNDYLSDEDVGIMTGDIKKAFGDKLHVVTGTPLDLLTLPVYDERMAMQINNAVALGNANSRQVNGAEAVDSVAKICQMNGLLYVENALAVIGVEDKATKYANTAVDYVGGFLNIHSDAPTPGDIMEATRLTNIIGRVAPADTDELFVDVPIQSCGSEIINFFRIYTGADSTSTYPKRWSRFTNANVLTPSWDVATADLMMDVFSDLTKFRWHPLCYLSKYQEDGRENINFGTIRLVGDIYNATSINQDWLRNCNRTALYSMLTTVSLGTFNPNSSK